MVNLILICGQGSTGKSTLINKIIKKDDLSVRLDNIPYRNLQEFVRRTQEGINQKITTIYADMAFDSKYIRQWFLSQLYWDKLNLYIIQLRPPLEKVLEWHKARIRDWKFTEEMRKQIITTYYNFEFVREDEFTHFNLNKVKIYLYDNYNQKVLFEK